MCASAAFICSIIQWVYEYVHGLFSCLHPFHLVSFRLFLFSLASNQCLFLVIFRLLFVCSVFCAIKYGCISIAHTAWSMSVHNRQWAHHSLHSLVSITLSIFASFTYKHIVHRDTHWLLKFSLKTTYSRSECVCVCICLSFFSAITGYNTRFGMHFDGEHDAAVAPMCTATCTSMFLCSFSCLFCSAYDVKCMFVYLSFSFQSFILVCVVAVRIKKT